MSRTLTAETIATRMLELSLNGVARQLREGRVLHVVYEGAAFVIATDADAARVMGEILAKQYPSVFIIWIDKRVADTMSDPSCRVEQHVVIRELHGTEDLNSIKLTNALPGPTTTQRGRMQLLIVLAEDLAAGDVYCDGDTDRAGLAVYTASASTRNQYMPGRMVFKRATWGELMDEQLIVPDGVGTPQYLVFMDGHEPWVGDFSMVLEEIPAFDQARIYLLARGPRFLEVRVESTDGDPDYMHWEVLLADTEEAGDDAGELVERAEYDDHGKPQIVRQHVHGHIPGV